jgi:hypothetical protein
MKNIISKIRLQKLAGILKENTNVDQILDKINDSGMDSLSSKEKEYLSKYSKGEEPHSLINEDEVIEYAKIMAYSALYMGTLKGTPWGIFDDMEDPSINDDDSHTIHGMKIGSSTMSYPFSLYEPFKQTWGPAEEYETIYTKDEKAYFKIVDLYKYNLNPDFIVTNEIFNIKSPTCPGAPSSAYGTLIEINTPNKTEVTISTPSLSSNGKYKVGWFDSNGKYYADTKNFDKNLNFIG